MRGTTHLVAGAFSSLYFAWHSQFEIYFFLIGAVAGLFPDIDASDSKIKHVGWQITKNFKLKPLWLPVTILDKIFKHRGFTHSFLGLLSFSALLYFLIAKFTPLDPQIIYVFSAGYLSHLITDALTMGGIPFFWPLINKRVRILPKFFKIKSGGWLDQGLLVLMVLGLAVFVLTFVWDKTSIIRAEYF